MTVGETDSSALSRMQTRVEKSIGRMTTEGVAAGGNALVGGATFLWRYMADDAAAQSISRCPDRQRGCTLKGVAVIQPGRATNAGRMPTAQPLAAEMKWPTNGYHRGVQCDLTMTVQPLSMSCAGTARPLPGR